MTIIIVDLYLKCYYWQRKIPSKKLLIDLDKGEITEIYLLRKYSVCSERFWSLITRSWKWSSVAWLVQRQWTWTMLIFELWELQWWSFLRGPKTTTTTTPTSATTKIAITITATMTRTTTTTAVEKFIDMLISQSRHIFRSYNLDDYVNLNLE